LKSALLNYTIVLLLLPLHHLQVGIGEGFGAAEVVIAGVGRAASPLGGFRGTDEFDKDARRAAVEFMGGVDCGLSMLTKNIAGETPTRP
jgi:hypothetical protein